MNILIIKSYIDEAENSEIFRIKNKYIELIKKVSPYAVVNVVSDNSPNLDTHLSSAEIVVAAGIGDVDLSKAKKLKWIHVTSAGLNRLTKEIIESELLITNSSGVHPIPISEHVLAFMLMFSRAINHSFRNQVLKKNWIRNPELFPVFELFGKTVVIVGLGRIGRRVAKLTKAFGMRVIGVVRNLDRKEENVYKLVGISGLQNVLGQADFIVNALPLTEQTFHLFDKQKFKKMKKISYFINIGRGKTVVEDDLILALNSEEIAGAGLDVFEEEPLSQSSKLWDLENVIITPHYSG